MIDTATGQAYQQALLLLVALVCTLLLPVVQTRQEYYYTYQDPYEDDLSLWINEQQVKIFSGVAMKIYAIDNGRVSPHIRDPNFSQYLPVIPSEVSSVNFTWKAGSKKYYYNFDRLMSVDESILKPPTISIKTSGRVPKNAKEFSVILPCSGNVSGIAMFSIGLLIQTRKGKPVPGTPLRIKLRKECAHRGVYERSSTLTSSSQGPDPECDKKCANKGVCNEDKICQCPEGYMGQYCQTALCYPQCMNGGNCTAPGTCSCPPGYQGRHCEGGICAEKCQNGGKCIQKDKCECTKGYYGLRCEYSKCVIPCLHDGKCRGVNKCRCKPGLSGDHCQIGRRQRSTCKRPCKHGLCQPNHTCACDSGWYGRLCNQREKKRRNTNGAGGGGDTGGGGGGPARLPKK
ncbi:protein shifted-like isoform X1 [Anopheles arabiensis]|uniref:Wnt inhibitory factor 1 n=1 Tax=Anopheles arabiensis TaxID=7173 RepID=A0A182HIJ2_ANOAR|nr:protein shifted-like isoform X1 [Anopheles arabiensis]